MYIWTFFFFDVRNSLLKYVQHFRYTLYSHFNVVSSMPDSIIPHKGQLGHSKLSQLFFSRQELPCEDHIAASGQESRSSYRSFKICSLVSRDTAAHRPNPRHKSRICYKISVKRNWRHVLRKSWSSGLKSKFGYREWKHLHGSSNDCSAKCTGSVSELIHPRHKFIFHRTFWKLIV
jgi:hypothetical protein